jgi:hypothetical protein
MIVVVGIIGCTNVVCPWIDAVQYSLPLTVTLTVTILVFKELHAKYRRRTPGLQGHQQTRSPLRLTRPVRFLVTWLPAWSYGSVSCVKRRTRQVGSGPRRSKKFEEDLPYKYGDNCDMIHSDGPIVLRSSPFRLYEGVSSIGPMVGSHGSVFMFEAGLHTSSHIEMQKIDNGMPASMPMTTFCVSISQASCAGLART